MKDTIKMELDRIAQASEDKLLHAEAVVEHAKDPQSPLYGEFEWDDSEAAKQHRLTQARNLIRCYVKYDRASNRNVRAYVSVPSDRANGGGYRKSEQVAANPTLNAQFIEEITAKIKSMEETYSFCRFLDPLWSRLQATILQFVAEEQESAAAG